jgi:hypothetical protein
MDKDRKVKVEKRDGKLFLAGEVRGYVQNPAMRRGGPRLVANDVRVRVDMHPPGIAYNLSGTAKLKNGSLSIIGYDSHQTSKVHFNFEPSLKKAPARDDGQTALEIKLQDDEWPEWTAFFSRNSIDDSDQTFSLDAHIPKSTLDELIGAYRRGGLAFLSFSIESFDLWEREGLTPFPSSGEPWYLPPVGTDDVELVASGKVTDLRWSEKEQMLHDLTESQLIGEESPIARIETVARELGRPKLAPGTVVALEGQAIGRRDCVAKSEDFMRRAFCGPSAARSWG